VGPRGAKSPVTKSSSRSSSRNSSPAGSTSSRGRTRDTKAGSRASSRAGSPANSRSSSARRQAKSRGSDSAGRRRAVGKTGAGGGRRKRGEITSSRGSGGWESGDSEVESGAGSKGGSGRPRVRRLAGARSSAASLGLDRDSDRETEDMEKEERSVGGAAVDGGEGTGYDVLGIGAGEANASVDVVDNVSHSPSADVLNSNGDELNLRKMLGDEELHGELHGELRGLERAVVEQAVCAHEKCHSFVGTSRSTFSLAIHFVRRQRLLQEYLERQSATGEDKQGGNTGISELSEWLASSFSITPAPSPAHTPSNEQRLLQLLPLCTSPEQTSGCEPWFDRPAHHRWARARRRRPV
jgi:hypothetical protein